MAISIGEIVNGKVVKTTNFGAFVKIEEGVEGLVHISELSNGYVKNVEDVVKVGDEVKVKIVSEKDGKIAMSIKQTIENKPRPAKKDWVSETKEDSKDMSFEDKLNKFIKQSNENLQQARTRENKRGNNRRKSNNSWFPKCDRYFYHFLYWYERKNIKFHKRAQLNRIWRLNTCRFFRRERFYMSFVFPNGN